MRRSLPDLRTHAITRFACAASLLLVSLSVGACDDDNNSSGQDNTDTREPTTDTGDTANATDDGGADTDAPLCNTSPDCDTDGDGIPDVIEAFTGTDPFDPDSDGDGLCDGSGTVPGACVAGEDFNHNGVYEPDLGELNNKDGDQNGNNNPDGRDHEFEHMGLVCNDETYRSVRAIPARSAQTNLALPTGFSVVEHAAAQASSFSDPARGVYGYVVKRTFDQGAPIALGEFEVKISAAGHTRNNATRKTFTTWWGRFEGLSDNGAQSKGSFRYGAGSDNPGATSQDPAALRDQIISALSGATVTTQGVSGTPCATVISHHVEEKRDADTLISIGVLACDADHQDPQTKRFFEEMLNSTLFAVANNQRALSPYRRGCDHPPIGLSGGIIDFLWVIDSSPSMVEEQALVGGVARRFADQLLRASIDWRVAVTTTDAYCLGDERPSVMTDDLQQACRAQLTQDLVRDPCTGLRGLNGFMNSATPDVAAKLEALITQDSACAGVEGAAPGANVCGFGMESGLLSAKFVLGQLQRTDLGAECGSGPAYQLRRGSDAKTVVIWVSDDVDAAFETVSGGGLGGFAPWPVGSPQRQAQTDAFVQLFTQDLAASGFDVSLFALVNDGAAACADAPSILGEGYLDVMDAASGEVGSLCEERASLSWVDDVIRQGLAQAMSFPLNEDAAVISSTIRIAVGDRVISPFDDGVNPFWTYDPDHHAVTLWRLTIGPGEHVVVAYVGWQDGE